MTDRIHDDCLYVGGVDTDHVFSIEATNDGGYFAVRDKSPRFVLWGPTIREVVEEALLALAAAPGPKDAPE